MYYTINKDGQDIQICLTDEQIEELRVRDQFTKEGLYIGEWKPKEWEWLIHWFMTWWEDVDSRTAFEKKCFAWRSIKKRIHENDNWFIPDWSDEDEARYFIYYNTYTWRMDCEEAENYITTEFYFSSHNIAQKAIEELEQEFMDRYWIE